MGKLQHMRGEARLTDLHQGQYHHVFSGGRRGGLGLGRAAAMVWQLAVGTGGLQGLEGLDEGEAGGGVWDGTGVAGRPGPRSLEAPVPGGSGWPGGAGNASNLGRAREEAGGTARLRHVS